MSTCWLDSFLSASVKSPTFVMDAQCCFLDLFMQLWLMCCDVWLNCQHRSLWIRVLMLVLKQKGLLCRSCENGFVRIAVRCVALFTVVVFSPNISYISWLPYKRGVSFLIDCFVNSFVCFCICKVYVYVAVYEGMSVQWCSLINCPKLCLIYMLFVWTFIFQIIFNCITKRIFFFEYFI